MLNRKEYINSPVPNEKDLLYFFDKSEALVIFDVGACEGEDSVKYSRLFPNAKIYSFEPLPKNIIRIEENLRTYSTGTVKLVPVALSDKTGIQVLNVSFGTPDEAVEGEDWDYGNKSSSLFPPDDSIMAMRHNWLKFKEQIEVKTDTILNYCTTNKIEHIDFIHMDVQGAELLVLKGAGSFISQIKTIWMEVSEIAMYKNQPLKKDIEKFMRKSGFGLYKSIVNDGVGDQFYINKKYFPGLTYLIPRLKDRVKKMMKLK